MTKPKDKIIKRIKKRFDCDLGFRSDAEYLSYLRKIGLPSLAKLLKIIHK